VMKNCARILPNNPHVIHRFEIPYRIVGSGLLFQRFDKNGSL
jgi:hypothetical protein